MSSETANQSCWCVSSLTIGIGCDLFTMSCSVDCACTECVFKFKTEQENHVLCQFWHFKKVSINRPAFVCVFLRGPLCNGPTAGRFLRGIGSVDGTNHCFSLWIYCKKYFVVFLFGFLGNHHMTSGSNRVFAFHYEAFDSENALPFLSRLNSFCICCTFHVFIQQFQDRFFSCQGDLLDFVLSSVVGCLKWWLYLTYSAQVYDVKTFLKYLRE